MALRAIRLRDRARIERFLRRNPPLHVYSLGDLDEPYCASADWYGLSQDGGLRAVALVYSGVRPPVLLALHESPAAEMRELLRRIVRRLPPRLYAHLSPGMERPLAERYSIRDHGTFLKMRLVEAGRIEAVDAAAAFELRAEDLDEVRDFYDRVVPGHWFVPAMFVPSLYYGLRLEGALRSVAGVHVFSPRQRVAALGNIATDAAYRGRGLAGRVTAALCRRLLRDVDLIGLNVKEDNAMAIACYRRLGFDRCALYGEFTLDAGTTGSDSA